MYPGPRAAARPLPAAQGLRHLDTKYPLWYSMVWYGMVWYGIV